MNASNCNSGSHRTGSLIGAGTSHLTNVAMNMMAFKNNKNTVSSTQNANASGINISNQNEKVNQKEKDGVSRSFSVNRAFGKDITNKILNSSGALNL